MKLNSHLHLISNSRMSKTIPPLPQTPLWRSKGQLYLSSMGNIRLLSSTNKVTASDTWRLYGHGETSHSLVMTQPTSLWKQRKKKLMTYSAITWQIFEELFIQETEHGLAPTCLSMSAKKKRLQQATQDRRTNHSWMQQNLSHLQFNPLHGQEFTHK